ncbi:hypothetical protein L2449_08385 [Mesorhizobium muleiense]|uniref:hypothetical protein n=1 Tax=Mesorhizobium muleiense TaxID=1004279 RepID=UPI001F24C12B|nr:hypothetical protein [Mesorhizobium muleiense]MCF6116936.1 hypothetical protein [Mesorhizobium muleiense]
MARALALATACLLAAGLSSTAGQGLFSAPPANAPADNAAPATPVAASPPAENARAAPVRPGSPTAVVKLFYEHVGLELDPAQRSHFVDPAKSVLDKSDALRKSGQGECLDPNMALDNAAYDRAEIDNSLKTVEAVKAMRPRSSSPLSLPAIRTGWNGSSKRSTATGRYRTFCR